MTPLHCPSCSRDLDPWARRCAACGHDVGTVRCASCFHVNRPAASVCLGCGEPLGLEPVSEAADFDCPACQHDFVAFRDERGRLLDCGHCGCQFVEHGLLVGMVQAREGRVGEAPPVLPRGPAADPVRYRPCPACGALMNRKNFGRASGVIVDVCRLHGTFFDPGELPRVLAFAQVGGMVIARERDKADAEEARRAAAAQASFMRRSSGPAGNGGGGGGGFDAHDAEAAVALFSFISGLGVD